jgi:hypothetical protein
MVLMVILVFCANTVVFPNENRISLGFEYGNFFEDRTDGGTDIETYMGSPGLNFCAYHLWDNFGFFHSHSFLFPNKITSNIDGYDYLFKYNFIIGPAYKILFTEKFDMTLGLGLSLGPTIGEINHKELSQFSMGIGGDIGFSFFLNKIAYINMCSIFSYQNVNTTSTDTGTYDNEGAENKKIEWSKKYNMTGIRPYLRIGVLVK